MVSEKSEPEKELSKTHFNTIFCLLIGILIGALLISCMIPNGVDGVNALSLVGKDNCPSMIVGSGNFICTTLPLKTLDHIVNIEESKTLEESLCNLKTNKSSCN